MGFLEDIDKGLRKMGTKIEQEDPAYIRTDCPKCGAEDIRVHKMRARHGHVRCENKHKVFFHCDDCKYRRDPDRNRRYRRKDRV